MAPRYRIYLATSVAVVVTACLLTVQSQAVDADACTNDKDVPVVRRIAGCSAVIADASADDATRARAHRWRGHAFRDDNRFTQAIVDYTSAIDIRPDDADALHNRSWVLRWRFRYQEALADANRAIALREDALFYAQRGWVYSQLSDNVSAISDFTSSLRLKSDNWDAYHGRGVARAESGDVRRALEDYQRAIELSPREPDPYYNRAISLSAIGQDDEALRDYSRVIELNPDYYAALINRSNMLTDRRDYAGALNDLNRAIELAPSATAYVNRAVVHGKLNDIQNAIADCNSAVRLEPSAESFARRARVFLVAGPTHFALAKADLVTALRMKPRLGVAYTYRGMIEYHSGNFVKALDDFALAREIDGDAPVLDYGRGIALKALKRTKEGQSLIDAARAMSPEIDALFEEHGIRRDPSPVSPVVPASGEQQGAAPHTEQQIKFNANDARALAARAEENIRRNRDFAGAVADYRRAVKLKPDVAQYWARLCWAAAVLGKDLGDALRSCEQALTIEPGEPYLLSTRGLVRLLRGEHGQSIADFDVVLRLAQPGFPADAYALYGRGIARLRTGDAAGAESDIANAEAAAPGIAKEFAAWGVKP